MNLDRSSTFSLVIGVIFIAATPVRTLQAADFSQQAPVVYDGTNRAYETPPVGGWEGVLEKEEAELKRRLAAEGNTNTAPQKDNAWDIPQQKPRAASSVPQNPQTNVYNVPQQDITWDMPDPYQKPAEYYTDSQTVWSYPKQGRAYNPQPGNNAWDAPGSQPQSGYYAAPQNAPGLQNNNADLTSQQNAWEAQHSRQGDYYRAAPQQYNPQTGAVPRNTGPVMQQGANPASQQNYVPVTPAPQAPQRMNSTAQPGAAPQVKPYDMPQTRPTWDDPQVAQGIWNNRAGMNQPATAPQQLPPGQGYGAPAYGGPGYGNRGYGTRGNTVPGFGGTGFRGPWNSGNSNRSFMPFGRRNSAGMFDPGRGSMSRNWDDMMNEPSRAGTMPGGWRAPSVSGPNPFDVSDDLRDSVQDVPDQMDNFKWNNR